MNSIATSNYNQNARDSQTLDYQETILGHLLSEQHHSLENALTYLASYAKEEKSVWEHCESVSSAGFWVGLVCGGVSFLAVGSGPIGLAVGGTIAAIGSGGSYWLKDLSERVGALRRTEFELHRHHPWIRDRLWELSQQGASTAQLVAIYDQMVFKMFANGIPIDGSTIAGSMGLSGAQSIAPAVNPVEPPIDIPADAVAVAVDNPIVTVVEQPIAVAPSYGVSKAISPLDILIKARFSHRAFFGGQRTGKSYLTAVASQELSKTGIKVFHMNLFSHGPEDSKYWNHASRSLQCDLSTLSPGEAVPFIRQAQSVLTEFKQTTGALLIIDEITSMGNSRSEHLEHLQPFINGLVSYINAIRDSSKKRQKAVWTIAPGLVAAGLDQGVKELVKGLSPVLVSIPRHTTLDWEGQSLTTDLNVYGQLRANYQGLSEPPSMDCDRCVLIDGLWLDMGELPKLMTAKVDPIASPSDITGTWREDFAKNLPPGLSESDFKARYDLEKSLREPSIPVETIEVPVLPVASTKVHPLSDKFGRLASLLETDGTITVKEVQTKLKISTSKEAQQLAQMFCISQKSRYKFASKTNPNGTTSYLIQAIT